MQTIKYASTRADISAHSTVQLHLRFSAFLALAGDVERASEQFRVAESAASDIDRPGSNATQLAKAVGRVQMLERATLAHMAIAFIAGATGEATQALARAGAAFRLRSRIAEVSCRVCTPSADLAKDSAEDDGKAVGDADLFSVPSKSDEKPSETKTGADELAKDLTTTGPTQSGYFKGKHLDGLQWSAAEVRQGALDDVRS